MGDEIQDPRRTLPGAVAWGGVLSGALYIGATLTLLIAVGKNVNVLQGIVQAVSHMAGASRRGWIIMPFALMLSLSIAGIGSAWMGGSRPHSLRRRPRFLHAVVARQGSSALRHAVRRADRAGNRLRRLWSCLNFCSARACRKLFRSCLSLAVVLQLVPFVYMFGALVKFAVTESTPQGQYGRTTLFLAGHQRIPDHDSRHRTGVFPGAADHVDVVVRSYGCSAARCSSSAWPHFSSSSTAAANVARESWKRRLQRAKCDAEICLMRDSRSRLLREQAQSCQSECCGMAAAFRPQT